VFVSFGASLEKLVSQSDGSLLAEGQSHISKEGAPVKIFGCHPTPLLFAPFANGRL